MKKYTHPQLTYTTVRYKDGSTQGIHWMYLRPNLILEANSKKIIELMSGKGYSVYNQSSKQYLKKVDLLNTTFWDN